MFQYFSFDHLSKERLIHELFYFIFNFDFFTKGNGSSSNSTKTLNPIVTPQLRVGSGTRRQYQNNYYRKRYSSIEMSSSNLGNVEKSMIINGAGLVKPTSLLTDIEQKSVNTNNALSNSLFPLSNITTGIPLDFQRIQRK